MHARASIQILPRRLQINTSGTKNVAKTSEGALRGLRLGHERIRERHPITESRSTELVNGTATI